jgi:hypothetical protein
MSRMERTHKRLMAKYVCKRNKQPVPELETILLHRNRKTINVNMSSSSIKMLTISNNNYRVS